MALTSDQQEVLEFERRWPRHDGDEDRALREYSDLSVLDDERLLARVLELLSAVDSDLVAAVSRQRRGEQWYARQVRQQGEWA